MASVNKVILVGNLGRNPEVKTTPSGTKVANFSIATSEKYTDKSGNKQDKIEWINIVAWGKLAELAGKYLKKGKPVYLEGKMATTSWEDKNGGGKRYKTDVVISQMQFLGRGNEQRSDINQEAVPGDMSDDMPF